LLAFLVHKYRYRRRRLVVLRYAVYLLYRYKSANTDAADVCRERKLAELSSAERWEVHADADADGGDLYHVELTTNMTERIRTLKLVCDSLLTCRGFNSNGWLKTRVPPASQVSVFVLLYWFY
jgi:hypothetical protein